MSVCDGRIPVRKWQLIPGGVSLVLVGQRWLKR